MNRKPPSPPTLTASDIARAVHCHPNTVRLYERWGYLPPVPRGGNGYRLYSVKHLRQMRLARTALPGPFPGGGEPVYRLVREAARGRFGRAMELARVYQAAVARETAAARAVLEDLAKWARSSRSLPDRPDVFSRRRASRRLGITVDALRTWERNGLVRVGKNGRGYCEYSPQDLARLRIIHALRRAGFSLAAVHKMFLEYDRGKLQPLTKDVLAAALDTPAADAPIVYVTDCWLSLLARHRRRAAAVRRLLRSPGGGGRLVN